MAASAGSGSAQVTRRLLQHFPSCLHIASVPAGLLRATQAARVVQPGPGRPSRSSHPAELAIRYCPHRWADPASSVQADAETEIRHRCHLIVSFLLERVHEKCVELRGFEPLTSCMPCLAVPSGGVLSLGLSLTSALVALPLAITGARAAGDTPERCRDDAKAGCACSWRRASRSSGFHQPCYDDDRQRPCYTDTPFRPHSPAQHSRDV
jgi:hypothetical protein